MNKAITDGLNLSLPAFQDGLDNWSDQNGRPGDTTYDTVAAGTLFAADPDFGTCLELQKVDTTQKLRSVDEVPLLPGCYLEIRVRVKAISGPLPSVRIAAWAGNTNGSNVTGVNQTGPATQLSTYGRVETITAIIGSGLRTGVDMVWGTAPVFGHMGIDVLGSNGAVIRVESVEVTDITSAFHRTMMNWVDVRDYGAIGDGTTDDATAFEAADADANGRDVLVSSGTYFLGKNVSILNRVRFEGKVTMAASNYLILRQNFDFLSYFEAFGDEVTALKKGLQAMFRFADHESFDLGGRRIQLDGPIDVAAAAPFVTNFASRRGIRNGQLEANTTSNWDPVVVTGTATYDRTDPFKLSAVSNITNIAIGSLISGAGVGREIYVTTKDETAGTLTISQPLVRATASQSYTFTRNQYMLDFSGFQQISRFQVADIEFNCRSVANAIMLAPSGIAWSIRDCWFTKPVQRAITSIGSGCNGIGIDRNQFIAPDDNLLVQNRTSIAFNTNRNDMKIRNNRCVEFKHFGIMAGGGHLVVGNHFWQGDTAAAGERSAGIVFCRANHKTSFTGNYVDGHFLEITNEYDVYPDTNTNGFGTIAIVGNIFTTSQVPSWYRFIQLSPIGNNLPIKGVSVIGNAFKPFGGVVIDRVDGVNTASGTVDMTATEDLEFSGNSFSNVANKTESPTLIDHTQSSTNTSWTVSAANRLPFNGRVLGVDGVTSVAALTNGNNTVRYLANYVNLAQGTGGQSVSVRWPEAVKGRVHVRVRVDRAS